MDLTVRRNSEIVRITSSDSCVGVKRKDKVQVLPLTKKNMTEDGKARGLFALKTPEKRPHQSLLLGADEARR